MAELRGVFGRTDDEPLPAFDIFPPEIIEFESPPGTYYDAFPLLVLTESALRSMRDALSDSIVDVRRFRPSIVIEADETGHPEFEWAGRSATRFGFTGAEAAATPRNSLSGNWTFWNRWASASTRFVPSKAMSIGPHGF